MLIKPGLENEYQKYVEINSHDAYSAQVVSYGDDWAKLMEKHLAHGQSVKDCAETCSHEADTDGITGFMYGAAVSALSHFWVHGDELRHWQNRRYLDEDKAKQADESGGVVNPAILIIND